MATKRKKPVKRESSFYETLTMPVGRSVVLPSVGDQSKNISKLLTITIAAIILVVLAVSTRSIILQNTASATPAGSIVISGASEADAVLQSTQSVDSFQSTRSDFQVQDNTRMQAFSDAANLQGGTPTQ